MDFRVKYLVCSVLLIVFCGLAASHVDKSGNSSWGQVFVPLFLMDGFLFISSFGEMRNGVKPTLRVLFLLVTKIIFEALLSSKLDGKISVSYSLVAIPLLLFLTHLSCILGNHIYSTIYVHTD